MNLAAMMRPGKVYRGWFVVSAPFLASAIAIGSSQYGFGLFVGPLEEQFGWTRTQISASLSFTAVGSLFAPFIGRMMDKHGAKKIMVVCLAFLGLSFLLRPLMSELWHWYALSFLQFIGFVGASALPAGRLVGIWFSKTRGRVMGLTSMGNNFGGLVIPPIIGVALTTASWQGGYLTVGILTFAVIIFAFFAVKEFPSASDLRNGKRERSGKDDGNKPVVVLTGWTVQEALHSRAFYAIVIAVLFGTFTYSTILPQITAHLTNEGVSLTVASLALSTVAIGGMAGKLALGFIAERITTRYTLMIDLFGQATFLVIMLFAASPALMWVSVPMFGFFMGGFGALFQLIVQDTFGIKHFGSIMGIINMTSIVSFGVGPILAGVSFDMTESYAMAFITVAVMFSLGSLTLILARPAKPEVQLSGQPAD